MLYMVIERYVAGPEPVYERAASHGRMLPDGLSYVDSWVVDGSLDRCFQLMETNDPALLDVWTGRWRDLVEFEVIPVVRTAEAARAAGSVLRGQIGSGDLVGTLSSRVLDGGGDELGN
jgi:hypothetical protein